MKTSFCGWALVLCLAACKKENSDEGNPLVTSTSYIKGAIDGSAKTFNFSAAASKQDLGGGNISYSIFGKATGSTSNYESFGFIIQTPGDLAAGTYSELDSSGSVYVVGIYNPNTTDQNKIFATNQDSTDPFEVTVTDINDSLMTGSFKGKLLLNNGGTSSVTVTAGDFKVKVQ